MRKFNKYYGRGINEEKIKQVKMFYENVINSDKEITNDVFLFMKKMYEVIKNGGELNEESMTKIAHENKIDISVFLQKIFINTMMIMNGQYARADMFARKLMPSNCRIDQMMVNQDYERCQNTSSVNGSCGDPSFRESNIDINETTKNNLMNIFGGIIKYIEKDIFIILGSHTPDLNFGDGIYLYFNKITGYENADSVIKKILSKIGFNEKKVSFYINEYFPLSHNFENSREVLDLILSINEIKNITIVNKMCGTCHRSLYHLVKNGCKYIVDPEQGLGIQDTLAIRSCFTL